MPKKRRRFSLCERANNSLCGIYNPDPCLLYTHTNLILRLEHKSNVFKYIVIGRKEETWNVFNFPSITNGLLFDVIWVFSVKGKSFYIHSNSMLFVVLQRSLNHLVHYLGAFCRNFTFVYWGVVLLEHQIRYIQMSIVLL